ncbi:hypothetical protein ADK55_24215 [Streptomyces sp. WM4235]|nr:hypothetical protein ADK55_24215 [Streptomyces sp. WM4235]
MAAVVALVVVLTRPSGTPSSTRAGGGEVFLQPASATGPAPFTGSTAAEEATPSAQSPPPSASDSAPATGATVTRSVSGAAPGLYGGTRNTASCDVGKQIAALTGQPAKNTAFASALGIRPEAVPAYLRSLTPLRLRADTRVTNHGYRDGKATPYQAVLEAGTAVLVDDRGVPRVRCACGNPLGEPVALGADAKRTGQSWPSYQPQRVVVIAPSVKVVNTFVIYDHHDGTWVGRDRADHDGQRDKPVPPPVTPTPTGTTSPDTTTSPGSGSPTDTDTPTRSPGDTPGATPSDSPPESSAQSPGRSPEQSPDEPASDSPADTTPSDTTPSDSTPSDAPADSPPARVAPSDTPPLTPSSVAPPSEASPRTG